MLLLLIAQAVCGCKGPACILEQITLAPTATPTPVPTPHGYLSPRCAVYLFEVCKFKLYLTIAAERPVCRPCVRAVQHRINFGEPLEAAGGGEMRSHPCNMMEIDRLCHRTYRPTAYPSAAPTAYPNLMPTKAPTTTEVPTGERLVQI